MLGLTAADCCDGAKGAAEIISKKKFPRQQTRKSQAWRKSRRAYTKKFANPSIVQLIVGYIDEVISAKPNAGEIGIKAFRCLENKVAIFQKKKMAISTLEFEKTDFVKLTTLAFLNLLDFFN